MRTLQVKRLPKEEAGFTLPEMLVTMTIMITVLFALYSIFDMSLRVFSFGNDKVEAAENARLGLEKMAREIRAAYPADKPNGETQRFWNQGAPLTGAAPTPSQITFGNDLNGNRAVVPDSALPGSALDTKEEITYKLSGTTLQRQVNNGGFYSTDSVVEFVEPGGLKFTYLKDDGTKLTDPINEPDIATVRIELAIRVDRGALGSGTQTLTTDVALRNRVS